MKRERRNKASCRTIFIISLLVSPILSILFLLLLLAEYQMQQVSYFYYYCFCVRPQQSSNFCLIASDRPTDRVSLSGNRTIKSAAHQPSCSQSSFWISNLVDAHRRRGLRIWQAALNGGDGGDIICEGTDLLLLQLYILVLLVLIITPCAALISLLLLFSILLF